MGAFRNALKGPPPSVHRFRLRHTDPIKAPDPRYSGSLDQERNVRSRARDAEASGYKGLVARVERKPGEVIPILFKLNKRLKTQDFADPFVRRMVYLDASMIAHNMVLDGTATKKNFGREYTGILDRIIDTTVPADRQEAIWKLIMRDHQPVLKKPHVRMMGPPTSLHEWRTNTSERIANDEKRPHEEQFRLYDKACEAMSLSDVPRDERLSVAYASAAELADMQKGEAERMGKRVDWGGAYTQNLLDILDSVRGREKFILLKKAFEQHLHERKASLVPRREDAL